MASKHWHSKDNYRSIWMYLYDVPHEITFVDAGGIRTRYLAAGNKDAPPLILLHGTASSFETFCANIEAHAEHFRVYAVDMIGNGFTDKPDQLYKAPVYVEHIKNFMSAMGIERASFLGVSLGSFVAAKLALDTPGLVDKIVMASPFGRTLPEPTGEPTKLDDMRAARMRVATNPTFDVIKTLLVPLIEDEVDRIDDLAAIRQAIYLLPNAAKSMANIWDTYEPTVFNQNALDEASLRAIQSETLIISCSDSADEFLVNSQLYADTIPNSRLVDIKKASHWPHWEQSEEFNPISIKFLTEGL